MIKVKLIDVSKGSSFKVQEDEVGENRFTPQYLLDLVRGWYTEEEMEKEFHISESPDCVVIKSRVDENVHWVFVRG